MADREVSLTVEQARAYFDDGDLGSEEFDNALDEAQGLVFTGKQESATILITITKENA